MDLNGNIKLRTLQRRFFIKILRYFYIFIFILIIFSCENSHAAQTVRIEIPAIVYINGGAFTLGEIAYIEAPSKIKNILDDLILSPKINSTKNNNNYEKYLTRDQILNAVKGSGIENVHIEMRVPSKILVQQPDYEGNETETAPVLGDVNLSALIKSLAAWDGNVDVTANAPTPPGVLIEPASIVPGSAAATLKFKDYKTGRVKSLAVRMTWTQNVLVAAKTINKDTVIRPQDLMLRNMKITKPGVYASRESEVVNNVSRKAIKQGQPIELALLSGPNMVKKGAKVKIIARLGGITATSSGTLMEDGAPGDLVDVRVGNNRSARNRRKSNIIKAYIINENTVEANIN